AIKFAQDPKVTAARATALYADAEAAFTQALEAFTKAGDRERADRIDFHLATVAIGRQNWRRANGLLAQYLARRPRDAEAYALYARSLAESGGGDAVIGMLQTAVRGQSDFVPLKLLLADAYRRYRPEYVGDIEKLYRSAVKDVPDVAAYRGLFQHLSRSGGAGGILPELDRTFQDAMPGGRTVTNEKAAERARAMILGLRPEPSSVLELLNKVVEEIGSHGPW